MKRILIAGMGNLLRGDDGFGIRVIERLASMALPEGVEVYEAGSAGVALAQKLMDRFDVCIIVDATHVAATERRGIPGTVYNFKPVIPADTREIGTHELDPSKVLVLARAMGVLPAEVLLIGCEPEQTEELSQNLSEPVAAAVEIAVARILQELERLAT